MPLYNHQANNKLPFQVSSRYYRLRQLELRFVLQMDWCITRHIRAQYVEATLQCTEMKYSCILLRCKVKKARKEAKIRKQCNQVPHLTQDTTWESNKSTINITNKSLEVSPFPADDHKAAMNRRKSMRNTRPNKHKIYTKEVPPWNGQ